MNNNLFGNLLKGIGLFVVACIALSMIFSVLGTLIWFAFRVAIPLAIIVFVFRLISNPSKKCRKYY